jgi:hypothetical protein
LLIKNKRSKKKGFADNSELIRNEILRYVLIGQKRYYEIANEIWSKIQGETSISSKSFQSVILKRRLDELEREKLLKRVTNEPRKVTFDFYDEKAKEKAEFLVYGSPEKLKDIVELLKNETKYNDTPLFLALNDLSQAFLFPFWFKIFKAILDEDIDSLDFYRKEGGHFLSTLFGVAVDTLTLENYRDEVTLFYQTWKELEQDAKNENKSLQAISGKKVFLRPERMDFWIQWAKEKAKKG